jgi:methylmalonyl-CoA mutase C-terminal domain/subunit
VRVAVDEDVSAVGLSILSGSHRELAREVLDGLRAAGAGDIPVFVGGTVPPQDRADLLAAGVKGVFTNDAPLGQMIDELARALG